MSGLLTVRSLLQKRCVSSLLIVGCALLYGLLTRLLFGVPWLKAHYEIVSLTYLILVPSGFGALTTWLGFRYAARTRFWATFAPCLVAMLGMVLALITKLEALLCVVVAAPVMLPAAMAGGLLMQWLLKRRSGRLEVSLLALLPLAVAPLEQLWRQPTAVVQIDDTIDIAAAPEIIWPEIVSVREISRTELPSQVIYWLDFPRPVSAEIDREGVGARRHAKFEREVSFFEEVTEWVDRRSLAFTIVADPEFIPHTAFDQHIIVGGRFYDVLDGRYVIEPLATGCRLHLSSRHRLSTPFNSYAGWWSEWVMRQIQGSILSVIKNRAEAAQQAAPVASSTKIPEKSGVSVQ